jgi:hypothetical protein
VHKIIVAQISKKLKFFKSGNDKKIGQKMEGGVF